MAQAIEVGKRMNAKYTILWHFSQRYAKIPFLSERKDEIESEQKRPENVSISFDFMRLHLSDLPRACELVPIFESMFYDEWLTMKKRQTRREQEPDYFTNNERMIESKRKHVNERKEFFKKKLLFVFFFCFRRVVKNHHQIQIDHLRMLIIVVIQLLHLINKITL